MRPHTKNEEHHRKEVLSMNITIYTTYINTDALHNRISKQNFE